MELPQGQTGSLASSVASAEQVTHSHTYARRQSLLLYVNQCPTEHNAGERRVFCHIMEHAARTDGP